ncbi:MAG: L,D-transpeptidase family protein [Pirellulales bacterium]|nr:L,D-transpeptidase family protein [Pirellulales bacterium]
MNSLKSLVMLVVLGGIGYGVWLALTGSPEPPPPAEAPPGWADAPPAIDMGEGDAVPTEVQPVPTEASEAPPFAEAPAAPLAAAPAPPGAAPEVEAPPVEAPAFGAAPPVDPSAMPDANTAAAPLTTQAAPVNEAYGNSYATPPADLATVPGAEAAGVPPAAPAGDFATALQAMRQQIEQGQLAAAHLALSQWYDNPNLAGEEHQQLMELLDPVAGTAVYSGEHVLEPAYVVQPGDTLDKIAAPYQVPWQLLAKINGIRDPNQLQPGTQLKVLRGPFNAVVDLDEFLLTLYLHERYAGRFRIGIGQDQSTPVGEYTVQNKVENPEYTGADGTIAADDPANPLGERWLDLGNHLGIHGTNDPNSVGRAESRGCIRMSPADIIDVYDILSVGSRVTIRH